MNVEIDEASADHVGTTMANIGGNGVGEHAAAADTVVHEVIQHLVEEAAAAFRSYLVNGNFSAPLTPAQTKYCASMLKALKRSKDGGPFNQPVDHVKLNLPNYPQVIKHPMDLSKMDRKLKDSAYSTLDSFIADFQLIINNCITFNGPTNPVSLMAKNLETTFERQLKRLPPALLPPTSPPVKELSQQPQPPKAQTQEPTKSVSENNITSKSSKRKLSQPTVSINAPDTGRPKREIHPPPPKDLPWHSNEKPRLRKKNATELRFCSALLKELQRKIHEPYAYPFYHPVDPVALNIPDYYKIIKEPMDMSTIETKLRDQRYGSAEEFYSDMKLIFKNCYRYNSPTTAVHQMGKRFEGVFNKKWVEKPTSHDPALSEEAASEDDLHSVSELSASDEEEDVGMAMLQKQMALMQQQMEEIARKKKKALMRKSSHSRHSLPKTTSSSSKKSKSKSGSHARRPSATKSSGRKDTSKTDKSKSGKIKNVITREQKKELSQAMLNMELEDHITNGVLEIIKETQDVDGNEGEIELDLDALDPVTSLKLYKFIVRGESLSSLLSSQRSRSLGVQSSNGKRQKKKQSREVLTEAQATCKMQEIQNRLSMYEKGMVGGAAFNRSVSLDQSGSAVSGSDDESDESEMSDASEND